MTQVLGIIGYPIGHTLSPALHGFLIEKMGLPFTYVSFEVHPDKLAYALDGMRGLGIRGLNVTIPHKQAVLPYLDSIEEEAREIGAVNTVSLVDGKLVGTNTDGKGFLDSLEKEKGCSPEGKRILLLGAGGATAGIAFSLAERKPRELAIANRTPEKARDLAEILQAFHPLEEPIRCLPLRGEELMDTVRNMDIIINTSSFGMGGEPGTLIPMDGVHSGQLVCDIVYRPLETNLLKEAKRRGAETLDGLGMLIHQGVRSLQIWSGRAIGPEGVRERLMKELESRG